MQRLFRGVTGYRPNLLDSGFGILNSESLWCRPFPLPATRYPLPALLPLILLLTLGVTCLYATAQGIPESERSALIALYQTTNSDEWFTKTNWLGEPGTENTWYGVRVEDGRVISLDLSNNHLTGNIPPELENLEELKTLRLGRNQLSGSIPLELGNLENLTTLSLEVNQLTGDIPPELGQLAKLEELYLSANQLSGELPPELGNLTKLRILHAYKNTFTGNIPLELGNLESLEILILSVNELSGNLPSELGNLTQLQQLYLNHNQLTGPITSELRNLRNCETLNLSNNQLSGSIPIELGEMASLEYLLLDNNALIGELPAPGTNDFPSLKSFSASSNQLTGPITSKLRNLRNCETLNLSRNQLSGNIPSELGELTNLYFLDLSSNDLHGGIPWSLGNLSRLYSLRLDNNRLQFGLPAALSTLERLEELMLANNLLSGSIPDQWTLLERLRILSLSDNNLSGSLPDNLGDLTALESILLSGNRLEGEIPSSIGNLARLSLLSLGDNLFNGPVPQEIGQCLALRTLSLSHNGLTGELPSALSNLEALQVFSLSHNNFTGPLPALQGLVKLKVLDLTGNSLSGPLPDLSASDRLEVLELGGNQLQGPFPDWLGTLSRLRSINLSGNLLAGSIPPEIGNLDQLSFLSLVDAGLSGSIPEELFNLTSLTELHLCGNSFEGPFPPELADFFAAPVLDLTGNYFSGQLPAELLEKPGLKSLLLDNNAFSSLPGRLTKPSDLETLSLTGNRIRQLPDELLNSLPHLRVLNLEGNRLSRLPTTVSNLDQLEVLSLGRNALSGDFPERLTHLSQLQILSVAFNRLTGILPQEILNLANLNAEASDLRGNRLYTSDLAVDLLLDSVQLPGLNWSENYLFFPFFSEQPKSGTDFTAFAIANRGTDSEPFLLEFFDGAGNLSRSSDALLEGSAQMALLGSEFFLCENPEPGCVTEATLPRLEGWVRAKLSSANLGGFFLFQNGSSMEGGPPAFYPAKQLIFSRTDGLPGASDSQCDFTVANPWNLPADLSLELFSRLGEPVQTTKRTLDPYGAFRESLSDLFGPEVPQDGKYLVVESDWGDGVVGFEVCQAPSQDTVIGLTPWTDLSASQFYSARFVHFPGTVVSVLRLISRSLSEATVDLVIWDGSDRPLATKTLILNPGQVWEADLGLELNLPTGTQGALEIRTQPGVIGDVYTLDPNLGFAAATHLDSKPKANALFSQVGNLIPLYTGLAVFNPGTEDTDVTVDVFQANGDLKGSKTITLPAHSLLAANLEEETWVPESKGQVGGYFTVRSDHPIVAQEIFVNAGVYYAAIPPSD